MARSAGNLPWCVQLMLKVAALEIARHVRDGSGQCREMLPCSRARQADLALAGF